ncbi:hypothetical protein IV203_006253 [Nitzschia inconspicua]|uniref:Uncharacterized protein n=1 Tax=Nitzschia inconspicua TaxID=303405 RepID=A0A9K3KPT9_9STRA|nr:hypothetical protein IV203_006253 [Nitzschia inconspicua]
MQRISKCTIVNKQTKGLRPQKGFDGRIRLQRVSRTKTLARASRNTRYSVDVDILQAINSGEWIQLLVTEGMTAEALLEEIKTHYDLDEYVSDRLVIGSPETNMLDLGIWMSIQAVVTRVHRRRGSHPDALARCVEQLLVTNVDSSIFFVVWEKTMIDTEMQERGPSPPAPATTPAYASDSMASAVSEAMKLRSLSPTDVLLSNELAMSGLWESLRRSAFSRSPSSSPLPSTPLSLPCPSATPMSSSQPSSAGALPLLAAASTVASPSSASAALMDHYLRVIRSGALARSVLQLEHSVNIAAAAAAALNNRRSSSNSQPAKARTLKTKFSLLDCRSSTAAMSRGMRKKTPLARPAGLQPLRAPPALPRINPGQQLIGMKPPTFNNFSNDCSVKKK